MPAPVSGVPSSSSSSTFAFFQQPKSQNPDSPPYDFHAHDPHPIKRHMDLSWQTLLEDGAPLPKRKVDRMSARLDKVHISPNKSPHHANWRKRQYRQETFEEIEQRLTDSSDDEMSDDNEALLLKRERTDNEEQTLQLSNELKEFFRRNVEKPVILPNPSPMNAVVPYVPRYHFEEPSMEGRISEITEDDAEWPSSLQCVESIGQVSFPDDSSLDEDTFEVRKPIDSEKSNPLDIVELEGFSSENTDTEMDMDCS